MICDAGAPSRNSIEITMPSGAAATELFVGLRDVDAKVRETKQVLRGVHGLPEDFIEDMGGPSV